jgi:hypothetical protein
MRELHDWIIFRMSRYAFFHFGQIQSSWNILNRLVFCAALSCVGRGHARYSDTCSTKMGLINSLQTTWLNPWELKNLYLRRRSNSHIGGGGVGEIDNFILSPCKTQFTGQAAFESIIHVMKQRYGKRIKTLYQPSCHERVQRPGGWGWGWGESVDLPSTQVGWVPFTVVARSKAWTVFARANTGIVNSNPTRGMDVYVRLFCV